MQHERPLAQFSIEPSFPCETSRVQSSLLRFLFWYTVMLPGWLFKLCLQGFSSGQLQKLPHSSWVLKACESDDPVYLSQWWPLSWYCLSASVSFHNDRIQDILTGSCKSPVHNGREGIAGFMAMGAQGWDSLYFGQQGSRELGLKVGLDYIPQCLYPSNLLSPARLYHLKVL